MRTRRRNRNGFSTDRGADEKLFNVTIAEVSITTLGIAGPYGLSKKWRTSFIVR